MTRWFLVVLMLLLPAQFSWAAAAPYCAHERDPVSFHVGHHAHVHRAASAEGRHATPEAEQAASQTLAASDHGDCHGCHGMAGQLAAPAGLALAPSPRHVLVAAAVARLEGGRTPSIERPKWPRAA